LNLELWGICDAIRTIARNKLEVKPVERIVEVKCSAIERWVLFQLKLERNVVYALS
jgi:hypothetical protein